jgi:hypothetical protein
LAEILLSFYIRRNCSFYPDGTVPIDKAMATAYLHRICSSYQFKQLLSSSPLLTLVDCFSYCALFAYGSKCLCKFDLTQVFLIRAERALKAVLNNNILYSQQGVVKLLSIFPWYTVPLLALGHNDMLREAIVIQQYLVLPHKSSIPTIPLSGAYGHIACVTRDLSQRLRWIRSIDQLATGNIPPYFDSYRLQILSCDVLMQEDAIFPWDSLGQVPADPEFSFRTHLLEHIEGALAKLPVYPTYVFRNVDSLKRGINAGFSASKAITLALLGRMQEAEPLAVDVVTSILPEDIEFFNIVTAFSAVCAMQILVALKKSEHFIAGFSLLNALIPEVPRTVRSLHRLLERLKAIGMPFCDMLAKHGTTEEAFFTNLQCHNLNGPHKQFLAKAVSLTISSAQSIPSSSSLSRSPPTLCSLGNSCTPNGLSNSIPSFSSALAHRALTATTTGSSGSSSSSSSVGSSSASSCSTTSSSSGTLSASSSSSSGPALSSPLSSTKFTNPAATKVTVAVAGGSSANVPGNSQSSAFASPIFPMPTHPYIPSPSPYFAALTATNSPFSSIDFAALHPTPLSHLQMPSAWQGSLVIPPTFGMAPSAEEQTFLGPYLHQSPLAEPPHPLTLLGQPKPK